MYEEYWKAVVSVEGPMLSDPAIVSGKLWVTKNPETGSVKVTDTLGIPPAVGVPLITPAVLIVIPGSKPVAVQT